MPKKYKGNNAPYGGWIDTETGTSFNDKDPYNSAYKEFVEWRKQNGEPDPGDPLPKRPDPLNMGAVIIDNDRARLQQTVDVLTAYLDNDTPSALQRKAWENAITRCVLYLVRQGA